MIEYSNQFKMLFSIGPYEDFIAEENMVQLKILEQAGNVMPMMEMTFKCNQSKMLKYLNETNPLKVQLGVKEIKIDTEYRIYHKSIDYDSNGWYIITLYCLMNISNYLLAPRRRTFGNELSDGTPISGLEVMMTVASENFTGLETNIQKSEDLMLRIQPGISNKQFIDEIWSTLYVPDSFVLVGVTMAGQFRIMDMRTLVTTDPVWNFTYKVSKPQHDIEVKKRTIDDNSGINNYLFGYIRQQEFWNEDTLEHYVSTTGNSTLMSMSQNFSRDNIWMQNTQVATNDNMFNEYWECRANNLANWALFSSVNSQVWYEPGWYDVKVLDLVMCQLQDPNGQPEEAFSGLAMVSAVSRIFKNRQIKTVVSLNREGFNVIR